MTHTRQTLSRPFLIAGGVLLGGCLLAPPPAVAQTAPAQPADDPSSIWTVQDENASISTDKLSDRYYTNGLRLNWTSPTSAVPAWMAGLGHALWGDGKQRISLDVAQQMYTPDNTTAVVLPPGDRPYAGVLMGTLAVMSDTATSRSTFSLGLGVVGPAALAEQLQDGFHDLIGQTHDAGWSGQLHNEPAIEITSSRVWRLNTGAIGGLETDAVPELTAGVGNVRVYALTGVTMRIGQGLDSDYGVARINPGLSGGDAFTPTRPFSWYVFAGVDGQVVAHDITLDGNTFQGSAHVKRQPYVGEGEAGLALIFGAARLTYTQVVQSEEFRTQKGGLHQFGSLALSVRF
jgi:lipid A 3-O-deacylase